jgi:hypothetical protein
MTHVSARASSRSIRSSSSRMSVRSSTGTRAATGRPCFLIRIRSPRTSRGEARAGLSEVEARRRLLGRSQSSVGLRTVGSQARHRGVPRRLQSGAELEYRHRHPRFHVQGTGGAGTNGSPAALRSGRPEAVKHRPLPPGHHVGSRKTRPPARHLACTPSQGRRGRAQSRTGSCLIR